jgi:cysteinyl-tRNA synthetase
LALTSHYRNYLNFSWESLESAKESLISLHKKTDPLLDLKGVVESEGALHWLQEFTDVISDDLNIPRGLGILNLVLKDEGISAVEKAGLVRQFDLVLGLQLDKVREVSSHQAPVLSEEAILAFIAERTSARKEKNWKRSDEIRDELCSYGIQIKDTPQGTTWEVAQ